MSPSYITNAKAIKEKDHELAKQVRAGKTMLSKGKQNGLAGAQ